MEGVRPVLFVDRPPQALEITGDLGRRRTHTGRRVQARGNDGVECGQFDVVGRRWIPRCEPFLQRRWSTARQVQHRGTE